MTHLRARFDKAMVYAAAAHAQQSRKGTGTPYLSHLLAVTALALENGANENQAIAALLHDVVEDCGGLERLEDVRQHFGNDVAEIVMGCTDATVIPKPPWKERKEAYLRHAETAPPSVLLVSACDKLHNIRSLVTDLRESGNAVWDRFKGGKEGTLWYYRSLVEIFARRGVARRLMGDLNEAMAALDRLSASPATPSTVSR